MDLYTFSLALGGTGLVAMALSGLTHGHGDHGHAQGHGHGHGHGDGHGVHHGSHAHTHQVHEGSGVGRAIVALLSPRVLFSVLVGFGLTGVLLHGVIGGAPLAAAAAAGGLLFEHGIVSPIWNFLFRFASAPALTLESCIEDEAEVVSAFDRAGHGLVAVDLDGQVVQLLATLRRQDRDAGIRPRMGERVRIDAVDAVRNRCTVRPLV